MLGSGPGHLEKRRSSESKETVKGRCGKENSLGADLQWPMNNIWKTKSLCWEKAYLVWLLNLPSRYPLCLFLVSTPDLSLGICYSLTVCDVRIASLKRFCHASTKGRPLDPERGWLLDGAEASQEQGSEKTVLKSLLHNFWPCPSSDWNLNLFFHLLFNLYVLFTGPKLTFYICKGSHGKYPANYLASYSMQS